MQKKSTKSRELHTEERSPARDVFPAHTDYHSMIAARVAALRGVGTATACAIVAQARATAALAASGEHPDVRVIRSAWEATHVHAVRPRQRSGVWAIEDDALRVMMALRLADRVPYEVLAAVWRAYTPERIAHDIAQAAQGIFGRGDHAHDVPQSVFLATFRAADAQLDAAQAVALHDVDSEAYAAVMAFYDALRASARAAGAAIYCAAVGDAPLHGVLSAYTASAAIPMRRDSAQNDARDADAAAQVATRTHESQSQRSTRSQRRLPPWLRTIMTGSAMVVIALVLVGGALYALAQIEMPVQSDVQGDARVMQ